MKNLTIRNIPDEIMDKIKMFSIIDKRSINNQILILLEKSVNQELKDIEHLKKNLSLETQVSIWEDLCGKWEDNRSTEEIIQDILSKRSEGREIIL